MVVISFVVGKVEGSSELASDLSTLAAATDCDGEWSPLTKSREMFREMTPALVQRIRLQQHCSMSICP